MTQNDDSAESRSAVLTADSALSKQYDKVLKKLPAMPEITSSLRDLSISQDWLLKTCLGNAEHLLESASSEYSSYLRARERYQQKITGLRKGKGLDKFQRMLYVTAGILVGSALLTLVALQLLPTSWHTPFYHEFMFCVELVLSAGVAAFVLAMVRLTEWGLLGQSADARTLKALTSAALTQLTSALEQTYLLPFVRTLLNEQRSTSLRQDFSVRRSQGLSEVHDISYHVPTELATRLQETIGGLSSASIGLAGSRGCGKSALLRRYCDEPAGDASDIAGDLRCLVAAPADYTARDFVLYLFATFCRATLARTNAHGSGSTAQRIRLQLYSWLRSLALIVILLAFFWGLAIAAWRYSGSTTFPVTVTHWVALALFAIGYLLLLADLRSIRNHYNSYRFAERLNIRTNAQLNLKRIRYVQTQTATWSGGVKLPTGFSGNFSRGTTWAEQPLSYPEIVDQFRKFAGQVARYVRWQGNHVLIGIDELDKIGSSEQAQLFLNEIKGIFGIPLVYFLVSVSDDALIAFERRGLPLRDVFDSCFDNIIEAEPFRYEESRRLLYRRIIGLNEPYIAFCHCLSGGLARDLIRTARQVIEVGKQCRTKFNPPAGREAIQSNSEVRPVKLADICPVIIFEEIRRKASTAAQLLYDVPSTEAIERLLVTLDSVQHNPVMVIEDSGLIGRIGTADSAESSAVASLRLELAGYFYFCMTLYDVFSDKLDEELMRGGTHSTRHQGHFDSLAVARRAFAKNTPIAWRVIDGFRTAWSLGTRALPTEPNDNWPGYL